MSGIIGDNIGRSSGLVKSATTTDTDNFVKLNEETFSTVSSISFDGDFTSDYSVYRFEFKNVYTSGAGGTLRIRYRRSDSDHDGSDYRYSVASHQFTTSAGTGHQGHLAQSYIQTGAGSTLDFGGVSGFCQLYDPLETSFEKKCLGMFTMHDYGGGTQAYRIQSFGGILDDATTALSGITFYPCEGTLTGTITMFGIT